MANLKKKKRFETAHRMQINLKPVFVLLQLHQILHRIFSVIKKHLDMASHFDSYDSHWFASIGPTSHLPFFFSHVIFIVLSNLTGHILNKSLLTSFKSL